MNSTVRHLVSVFGVALALTQAASCRAGDLNGNPLTNSLLEQAEAEAKERRFFGPHGLRRPTSGYFERARDDSTPLMRGRFAPQMLQNHTYGRIKPGPEDSLALRSLTNYYGQMQPRTRQRAASELPGSQRPSALSNGADLSYAAERMQLAREISASGNSITWQDHSLDELQSMARRIAAADRLRQRGIDVDWSRYSVAQLTQIAEHVAAAEQRGQRADWSAILRLVPTIEQQSSRDVRSPTLPPATYDPYRSVIPTGPPSGFNPLQSPTRSATPAGY